MKPRFIILLSLMLFVTSNEAFSQWKYFLQLFKSEDKETLKLIEENTLRERRNILDIEDRELKNELIDHLHLREKGEIRIPAGFNPYEQESVPGIRAMNEEVQKKISQIFLSSPREELSAVGAREILANAHPISRRIHPPTAAERTSLKRIDKVQVCISIPEKTQEFRNIFRTIDNRQLANFTSLKSTLVTERNPNVHFWGNVNDFLQELNRPGDSPPLIIIGHNDNGSIRFPDGSEESIHKIDSLLKSTNRLIIYLSCNASLYTENPATNYFLTYDDAIAISNRINMWLEFGDPNALKKAIPGLLEGYERQKRQQVKYKIVIYTLTLSGTAYTYYVVKQGNIKPNRKPPIH